MKSSWISHPSALLCCPLLSMYKPSPELLDQMKKRNTDSKEQERLLQLQLTAIQEKIKDKQLQLKKLSTQNAKLKKDVSELKPIPVLKVVEELEKRVHLATQALLGREGQKAWEEEVTAHELQARKAVDQAKRQLADFLDQEKEKMDAKMQIIKETDELNRTTAVLREKYLDIVEGRRGEQTCARELYQRYLEKQKEFQELQEFCNSQIEEKTAEEEEAIKSLAKQIYPQTARNILNLLSPIAAQT